MTQQPVILHSDMNNFYASVECLDNPCLRRKPAAVTGDPDARHGIMLMDTALSHLDPVAEHTMYPEAFLKSPN